MYFNSISYLLFLPITFLIHAVAPQRFRWIVLLAASFIFYGCFLEPVLPVVLLAVISVTWLTGFKLARTAQRRGKLLWLWLGAGFNLAVLIYFKYLAFILHNFQVLARWAGHPQEQRPVKVLAIIGVSYYVFQAVSYLADLYFGSTKPEPHLGYFALYLSFFPKLVQGPIERSTDLLPQLRAPYAFEYENVRQGLLLFCWGLFKKVLVADRLGLFVDPVFANLSSLIGPKALLAAWLYAVQLFCDFSGYTDMALGSALLFNIRLTQNFNAPYAATSMRDFWRRWHISLSRWILDYVFEPLQILMRHLLKWGTALALFIAFFTVGVWHGAKWGYAVFGLLQGLYMASAVFYQPLQKKLHAALRLRKTRILKIWQVFFTFNLVSLSLIFFRAAYVGNALLFLRRLFVGWRWAFNQGSAGFFKLVELGPSALERLLAAGGILIVLTVLALKRKAGFYRWPAAARWLVYMLLLLSILFCGRLFEDKQFIYAQF